MLTIVYGSTMQAEERPLKIIAVTPSQGSSVYKLWCFVFLLAVPMMKNETRAMWQYVFAAKVLSKDICRAWN